MSRYEKYANNFKGQVLAERTLLHLKNRLSFETTVPVALALEMVQASLKDLQREEDDMHARPGRKR